MLFAGDFHACLGMLSDMIEADLVLARKSIDVTQNNYGKVFADFLLDLCCCTVNGRIATDGFTCLRVNGRSMVDYFAVPHDNLACVKDFKVVTCHKIVSELRLK